MSQCKIQGVLESWAHSYIEYRKNYEGCKSDDHDGCHDVKTLKSLRVHHDSLITHFETQEKFKSTLEIEIVSKTCYHTYHNLFSLFKWQ